MSVVTEVVKHLIKFLFKQFHLKPSSLKMLTTFFLGISLLSCNLVIADEIENDISVYIDVQPQQIHLSFAGDKNTLF